MNEPTFDHERLDVNRLSVDYVAFSYRIAKGQSDVAGVAKTSGQSDVAGVAKTSGQSAST